MLQPFDDGASPASSPHVRPWRVVSPHACLVLNCDVRPHLFGKPLYPWEFVVEGITQFSLRPCQHPGIRVSAGQPHRLQVLPHRRVAHRHPELVRDIRAAKMGMSIMRVVAKVAGVLSGTTLFDP